VQPSKEALLAAPLLLIALQSLPLALHHWRYRIMLAIALPITPFAAMVLLLVFVNVGACLTRDPQLRSRAFAGGGGMVLQGLAALLSLVLIASEGFALHHFSGGLDAAVWVSVCAGRYFAWRVVCNTLAYWCQLIGVRSVNMSSGTAQAAGSGLPCGCKTLVTALFYCFYFTISSVALLTDVIFGATLQLPFTLLTVASMPLSLLCSLPLRCLGYGTVTTSGLHLLHYSWMMGASMNRDVANRSEQRPANTTRAAQSRERLLP